MNAEIEKEKREQMEMTSSKSSSVSASVNKQWSEAETAALIKGVNLFPAGTQDRWDLFVKSIHLIRNIVINFIV